MANKTHGGKQTLQIDGAGRTDARGRPPNFLGLMDFPFSMGMELRPNVEEWINHEWQQFDDSKT